MTLTMIQLLALLRNAMKEKDDKDVLLFTNILVRSISDSVVLQLMPEIQKILQESKDYLSSLIEK